jgi:hypothetical protein
MWALDRYVSVAVALGEVVPAPIAIRHAPPSAGVA